MKHALMLAGFCVAFALLIAAVFTHVTAPVAPVAQAEEPQTVVNKTQPYREVGLQALKQAYGEQPRTVTTERVVVSPPVTEPEPLVTQMVTPKPTVQRDICRGKGKRYYNGKRDWRCRR